MKKGVIILLIILIFVLILITWQNFEENKEYKGELAEASPRPQDISISVLPTIPILTIISPENITYSTSTILLNYSVKNEVNSTWYNLDSGINITITSPSYFSAAEGSHILYLYANNSQGISSKNITFSIEIGTSQPPSGGGGGDGSTGNKTEQQKENTTATKETSQNITEKEIPEDITKNPEETPRISKGIIIKFVISLLFLILLILLIIILIEKIKRKNIRKKKVKR